nr:hypothetical protein [uncultured Anaerostipes sp.]
MTDELLKNTRELIAELEKLNIDEIEKFIDEVLTESKKNYNERQQKLAVEMFTMIKEKAIENKKALHSQANELQG